jgi:hypothetical protein
MKDPFGNTGQDFRASKPVGNKRSDVMSSGRSGRPVVVESRDAPKFEKFVPRFEKEQSRKHMLDEVADFQLMPQKFMCQKHREEPVEFVSTLNETFFCKLCLPKFHNHDNVVLADKYLEVQTDLVKLRHTYLEKKQAIKKKLDSHTEKIEKVFKFYYDGLDEIRKGVLEQEYYLSENMDGFEESILGISKDVNSYNLIEFYHDQNKIRGEIRRIESKLKDFDQYMPKYALVDTDFDKIYHQIKVDLRERINGIIKQQDRKY